MNDDNKTSENKANFAAGGEKFAEIYSSYSSELLNSLRSRFPNLELSEVEEIVQDTFMDFHQLLTTKSISLESTTSASDSRRLVAYLLKTALHNTIRRVMRQSASPSLLITLEAFAEEGVSADRVSHHLVELYKALNEYSLAQYGTHLTREGFKRLVFQGTGVHV